MSETIISMGKALPLVCFYSKMYFLFLILFLRVNIIFNTILVLYSEEVLFE